MNSRLMNSLKLGAAVFVTANMLGLAPAHADEIKIGLLSQYSGTYSWWGQEYDRGVGLYLDEHGGKIDGHTITIVKRDDLPDMARFELQTTRELARFIATKGSVTLDGVSLTVNTVDEVMFSVLIIPHTLEVTTLNGWRAGSEVNIEVDLMARYAARLSEME